MIGKVLDSHWTIVGNLFEIFVQFLTASYASLAVQGIAFRQEQVVKFAQILEYFVMFSSRIVLYKFEASLDMFVELYQILQFYNFRSILSVLSL